jgi:hypothetical protein
VVTVADQQKKNRFFYDFLNDDFKILRKKNSEFFLKIFVYNILKFSYMKKNVGISISKCLKSAAKNRHANQTVRAILSAPTVYFLGSLSLKRRCDKIIKIIQVVLSSGQRFCDVARVSPHIRFEANIANLEANIFKRNSKLKG